MKNLLKCLVVLLFVLSGCNPGSSNTNFTLEGEISGLSSGLIIMVIQDSVFVADTAIITDGKFVFERSITEPLMASLNLQNSRDDAPIFIEPGNIKIELVKDDFDNVVVSGSESHKDKIIYDGLMKHFYDEMAIMRTRVMSLTDSINASEDLSKKSKLEAEVAEIRSDWGKKLERRDSETIKYIIDNPESYVAGFYLSFMVQKKALSPDSLRIIYNLMNPEIQEGKYGRTVGITLDKQINTQIGVQVPDFEVRDVNGDLISFSELKNNKVLIIDFWASWCVPCRKSIPHLMELYNKYNAAGLEIIAVAEGDTDRDSWIKGIDDNGIGEWYNVASYFRDGTIENTFFTDTYYFNGIPFTMLIDRDGKIAALWSGYSEENEEDMDRVLKDIFTN